MQSRLCRYDYSLVTIGDKRNKKAIAGYTAELKLEAAQLVVVDNKFGGNTMKRRIFLIFGLFLMVSISSYARDLVIAGISEEPNRWKSADGEFKGLDVDVIDHIMKKIGIKYKIILETSSTRLQKNWMKKDSPYDMVFTYSQKDSRKVYLDYAKESHIIFSWNFFIRKSDEGKFVFRNFEDLKGLKIGATKDFSYTPAFWKAGKEGIFRLDKVGKNEIQLTKLFGKRFDMAPLNTQATLYEAKKKGFSNDISFLPKPIKSKPYYNTFVKSSTYPNINEIRNQYDIILGEMKKDGTLNKILDKYGLSYEN